MYKNRYGDTVEFIPLSETEIEFKVTDENGEASPYWRFGFADDYTEENKKYQMADPSGGPYIAIGHNMGIENKQFKGKKVKYITNEKGKIIIHI